MIRLCQARRAADTHISAVHHARFLEEIGLFHARKDFHDNDLTAILQFHADTRENARFTAFKNLPCDLVNVRNDFQFCRKAPAALAVENDAPAPSVRKSHSSIQKRSALRHDLLYEIAANPHHFFLHIQHLSAIHFLCHSITAFARKVQDSAHKHYAQRFLPFPPLNSLCLAVPPHPSHNNGALPSSP